MTIRPEFTPQIPVAFFCAEYAIEETLHLYAGGLGVLAGDFILEAGAQNVPLVALGLWYPGGPYSQKEKGTVNTIDALKARGFALVADAEGKELTLSLDIEERVITVRIWSKRYGSATLYLLDTDLESNTPEHRALMRHLYDANHKAKMLQELVLGIGGIKLLRTLGIRPAVYHLNEGHTSFVALALGAEYMHDHPEEPSITHALKTISSLVVATKHTILSGAGIYFTKEELANFVAHYFQRHRIDLEEFFSWGADETGEFSATRFLLKVARAANGVSKSHTLFEKKRHPNSTLVPITNGIHPPRWYSPRWSSKPFAALTNEEVWNTHSALRQELTKTLMRTYGCTLNPEALTVVWARRFAPYKRPQLLFSDLDALQKVVADETRPVQFVISGTGREAGAEGEELMRLVSAHTKDPRFRGRIVYIPEYSLALAKLFIAGADVWLNTPEPGQEACGTSGMKAGLNGVLQMSTSEGWIDEVDLHTRGWILPAEHTATAIYDLLEKDVPALFYEKENGVPHAWVERMRATHALVNDGFIAKRMLTEYLEKMY